MFMVLNFEIVPWCVDDRYAQISGCSLCLLLGMFLLARCYGLRLVDWLIDWCHFLAKVYAVMIFVDAIE